MAKKRVGVKNGSADSKSRTSESELFEARAALPDQIRESGLFDLDYDPDELSRMKQIFEQLPDQTIMNLSKQLGSFAAEKMPDFSALSKEFGISSAERKLLESLVEGQTVVAHAEKVGISVNTARTHMRRLLEKTGSSGQLDLIRKAHGQS